MMKASEYYLFIGLQNLMKFTNLKTRGQKNINKKR